MLHTILKPVNVVDEVQQLLGVGVYIHPTLYRVYITELHNKEHKQKLCLLPFVIMEEYHRKTNQS